MNTELKTKIEEFALFANIDPTLLGRFITNVSDANLDMYIGTFIKYRNYYVYVKANSMQVDNGTIKIYAKVNPAISKTKDRF